MGEKEPKTENKSNKILIPVDFSNYSMKACEFAFNLAKTENAEVILLHVYFTPIYASSLPYGGYRRCPFCEEGDHPRKIKYNSSKQSGGRRVSDKKQTQSVRGAMAAVLVVVLLLLSWSLFGDKIVAKITPADDDNTPGVQDDVNTPDDSNTNTDDPNANNGGTTDPNTGDEPNANDPANGSDTTATNPGTTTTPSTPTVDASALSIKTNVGTTLPKDANGNFDCTIKSSETIRLSVSGTDAAATWAVADASVLSISADGLITPAKVGTTTVTATVGGAVLTITVRIK